MKSAKMAGLVVACAMLLSAAAVAGNKPVSLAFASATQINGKQVPAGAYQLKWKGNGPEVQVQFIQRRKVIATVPAKLQQTPSKADRESAVIETAGGGRSLVEVRLAGKNYKLVFPGAEAQAQNTHANGGSADTNR
ncbi:MAG TPA: hypothetical protein VFU27_05140 [Terriglobales bacterium]|nr:hypothetical protein [Terriglobales bacterium]